MITFFIPEVFYQEISYTINVLFSFWGKIDFKTIKHKSTQIICEINDKKIKFYSHFFTNIYQKQKINFTYRQNFIHKENILTLLFPFNYGIKKNNDSLSIDLDIFGSSFILLTGLETINSKMDKFGRFEGKNSKLIDLVERPILQEYYFFLKDLFLFYNITLKNHIFKAIATHDVDHPNQNYKLNWKHFIKNCLGDLITRKTFPIKRLKKYLKQDLNNDPFNTFSYFEKKEEKIQSIYYFFAGNFSINNPSYNINDKHIIELLTEIKTKADIGIHLGLGTYNNFFKANKELKNLKKLLNVNKTRFHFLAFDIFKSIDILENLNIIYDSTFAYRDYAGFRSGSCYPFPLFNLKKRKITTIIEHPLILMESTILDNKIRYPDPLKKSKSLINKCKNYGGEFTLLWHNHRLTNSKEKNIYEKIIKELI